TGSPTVEEGEWGPQWSGFLGSDYIQAPGYTRDPSFSVELRLLGNPADTPSYAMAYGDTTNGFALSCNATTSIRFWVSGGTVQSTADYTFAYGDHIVGVHRGDTIEFWANGSLFDTTTQSERSTTVAGKPLTIGDYSNFSGLQWNSTIARPRVYSRALDPAEIATLANEPNALQTKNAFFFMHSLGATNTPYAIMSRRLPWLRRYAPVPGDGIDQADRQSLTHTYGGTLADGGTSSGTIGATAGGATTSLAGTVLNPVTGTIGATAGGATTSLAGTVLNPVSGTIGATAGGATASLAGTFEAPVYEGTIGATTGGATADLAGIHAAALFTGEIVVITGGATASLAGTSVAGTYGPVTTRHALEGTATSAYALEGAVTETYVLEGV
ncbi:MAG: LamG domain-containing protein, partial [Halieaceae bacterium]|nr:LamG domain-containing protein [Halieaceae bacterium]